MTQNKLSDENLLDWLEGVITKARGSGADAADLIYAEGKSISTAYRLGKLESMDRAEGIDLGLRALIGKRQAIVSTSDTSDHAIDELVERAMSMASVVPEDEFCGLASKGQLATEIPDLDECDPIEPDASILVARAKAAEAAALEIKGVTNSEGAEAGWSQSRIALSTSNGFGHVRLRSNHSISTAVLAGEGLGMERDYDWASTVHGNDLPDPVEIGRNAGQNAVKRLNPRKISSLQAPVVYAPRAAQSIVSHLANAVNGSSICRGTSFLKDSMAAQIFSEGVTIVDDPLRQRGLRSKAFDGEGLACSRKNIIEKGVLKSWILDLRSARQLKLNSTGNASRGTSSPPSPSTTNLYIQPGILSPAELMSDIKSGLYITGLMGQGANLITGDYSRGAEGFWIENGEISGAVSELTIAGNLNPMFKNLVAANDLEFRFGTNAPTLRIDGMTIAGK